jgi:DNA-binding transcriptional regulator YiaG
LVDEIKRVLDKRTVPFSEAELEMLGQLGRRALTARVQAWPLSEAIKKLRDHLDMSQELLASGLKTTPAVIEEFEAGTRKPGKKDLEAMLWLARKTIHKLPELELAFNLALERAGSGS